MAAAEQIDALRGRFPSCEVLAYADLGTGMVLYASTRRHRPQEDLDQLCEMAADLTIGPTARGLLGPGLVTAPVQTAVVLAAGRVELFLRPAASAEVLCCECGGDIDLPAFLAEAEELARHLGEAD